MQHRQSVLQKTLPVFFILRNVCRKCLDGMYNGRNIMKRKMAVLCGACLIMTAAFSACQKQAAPTPPAETVSTAQEAESESTVITITATPTPTEAPKEIQLESSDKRLLLTLPESWTQMQSEDGSEELEQSFPLHLENTKEGAFIIGNTESKTETSLGSFEEYAETLMTGVGESDLFSEVEYDGEAQAFVTDRNMRGQKRSFTALYTNDQNESVRVKYLIYAFDGQNGYIQINCWSEASKADALAETFDKAVRSLQEHETAEDAEG